MGGQGGGGLNRTDGNFCGSHPVALSLYLRPPKKFQMKIPAQLIGVAETVDDTKDRFKKPQCRLQDTWMHSYGVYGPGCY